MNKPLPPYGLKLRNFLAAGGKPKNNVFVFIGSSAFQKARAFEKFQYVLALPYGVNPDEFIWPVQGCRPLVFDTGGAYLEPNTIRKLGYILLSSGAIAVHIVLFNGRFVVYRKEAKK